MGTLICPNLTHALSRAVRGRPWTSRSIAASTRWTCQNTLSRHPSATLLRPYRSWTTPGRRAPTQVGLGTPLCLRSMSTSSIIREYEDLPAEYRDQQGLPFRKKNMTEQEAAKVFGASKLDAKGANNLLRILHGRRVAGTLDDPAFVVHTAEYTDEQIETALGYLRKHVPVDEVLNAGLRAEDELEELDREAEQTDHEATGKEVDRQEQATDEAHPPATPAEADYDYKADPIYGPNVFDQMRARNAAKRKADEKVAEEARQAAEAAGVKPVVGPLAKFRDPDRQIENPRVAEYYRKAQSDLAAPPEMTVMQRVLPSVMCALLILGFLAGVAMVYEEPSPRYRLFPDLTTGQATVGAIIVANLGIWVLWRLPPLWRMLNSLAIMNVATANPLTMFTSIFSHQGMKHLLFNTVPLWFVGPALHADIGRADFLTLYVACGAAGFLSTLTWFAIRGPLGVTSLGASGALLGVTTAYLWEHRSDGFRFLGLPDEGVHGIVWLALLAAVQLSSLGSFMKKNLDLVSHLGGMAAGLGGMELINRLRGRHAAEEDGTKRKVIYDVGQHARGAESKGAGGQVTDLGVEAVAETRVKR